MKIKPSTSLRNEYNDISMYCKESMEPVYLTKNGEGDLVVMSLEAYSQREKMLDLREKLLEAEISMASGNRTYTLEEVSKKLEGLINDRK